MYPCNMLFVGLLNVCNVFLGSSRVNEGFVLTSIPAGYCFSKSPTPPLQKSICPPLTTVVVVVRKALIKVYDLFSVITDSYRYVLFT